MTSFSSRYNIQVFTILLLVVLATCKNKAQSNSPSKVWTEEQKRKYYTDSFSIQATIFKCAAILPSVSTNSWMNNIQNYRLQINTILSFMHLRKVILIPRKLTRQNIGSELLFLLVSGYLIHWYSKKKDKKSVLTTKITNGMGGNYYGVLISTMHFQFSDTLYNKVANALSSLNFWSLGEDATCTGGFDGETWFLEAIENGRYNIVRRWVPQGCGNDNTAQLAEIGRMLGRLGKLDNVLKAIGARESVLEPE